MQGECWEYCLLCQEGQIRVQKKFIQSIHNLLCVVILTMVDSKKDVADENKMRDYVHTWCQYIVKM